jgi:hypothetical protein
VTFSISLSVPSPNNTPVETSHLLLLPLLRGEPTDKPGKPKKIKSRVGLHTGLGVPGAIPRLAVEI